MVEWSNDQNVEDDSGKKNRVDKYAKGSNERRCGD